MIALLVALMVALPGKPVKRPALKLHDDVVLNDELRPVISKIAELYNEKTNRTLEITSGARSPLRQAGAMYIKLRQGSSLSLYRKQSLIAPIKKAYREGRKKKLKKEAIVQAMAEVIEAQMARGEFISRHLKGRAFDARIVGMSGKQRAAFKAAVREVGGVRVLVESKPPHFHCEIVGPQSDGADEPEGDEEGHEER